MCYSAHAPLPVQWVQPFQSSTCAPSFLSLYFIFICQENQARGFIGKTRIHQRTDGESGTFIMMKLKKRKKEHEKDGFSKKKRNIK